MSLRVGRISECLASAWQFLSGQERVFDGYLAYKQLLRYADYSCFMPLHVDGQGETGGVGVLLPRHDALSVAAHMFGAKVAQLQDGDLVDASNEVCNLFSDCVALHVSGDSDVRIGLPTRVDAARYQTIADSSQATAVYRSGDGPHCLYVVVYDILRQSE